MALNVGSYCIPNTLSIQKVIRSRTSDNLGLLLALNSRPTYT